MKNTGHSAFQKVCFRAPIPFCRSSMTFSKGLLNHRRFTHLITAGKVFQSKNNIFFNIYFVLQENEWDWLYFSAENLFEQKLGAHKKNAQSLSERDLRPYFYQLTRFTLWYEILKKDASDLICRNLTNLKKITFVCKANTETVNAP